LFIAWVGCAADPREDELPPSVSHEPTRALASDRVAVKVGDRITETTDHPPLGIDDVRRAAPLRRAPRDVYTAEGLWPPKAVPTVMPGDVAVVDHDTRAKYAAFAEALQQELRNSADLPERERRARIAALKRRIVLGE
jgi:hypothetical protein